MDSTRRFRWAVLVLVATLLTGGVALAQSGGDYDLSWSTIDGGGHTLSSGGDYTLGGTIGQADAGLMSSGDYALSGGFWFGGALEWNTYVPLVLRSS